MIFTLRGDLAFLYSSAMECLLTAKPSLVDVSAALGPAVKTAGVSMMRPEQL